MIRSIALLSLLLLSCKEPESRSDTGTAPDSKPDNELSAESARSVRIMSYNVLKFGDACQADNSTLHQYLGRIVSYAKPDILGLIKVAAIGKKAPVGFQDSIVRFALNGDGSQRYAVCPYSGNKDAKDINLLFFNQQKFGFAGMQTIVSDITDFNLYKLYYKAGTVNRDTSFLYVLLLHTESGDESEDRDRQLKTLAKNLQSRFRWMPPLVILGDFNLRNTSEAGYAALTQGNPMPLFNDPPFALDKRLHYPADWEQDPEPFAGFLTTSTRKQDDEPNSCGTGGGAKFWYDHILLSQAAASDTGFFKYVPGSFKVLGNDGGRVGHAIYSEKHPNKSVPPRIAEALYQFSNKYPVMLELMPKR